MKDMFGNLDTMCYQPSSTNTTGRNLLNHITRRLKANSVAESRPQMVRSGRKSVQDGQKKQMLLPGFSEKIDRIGKETSLQTGAIKKTR